MKNVNPIFCASLFLFASMTNTALAFTSETSANDEQVRVQVTWQEPEKYTDTRAANMSSKKHREHIFKQLEAHLAELSENLPAGQSLKLTVTNLDLAGRVEPGRFSGLVNSANEIRIVRDIDIPRMAFSYQLLNANGGVLKSEDVKLKDMSFLHSTRVHFNARPFAYEKHMLTEWFEDNFTKEKA